MKNRTRWLFHASVLFSLTGAIFYAGKPEPSSAQTGGFKLYEVQLWCGDSGLPTKILGHEVTTGGTVGRPLMGTKVICIGKCQGRRITMADAFAGLPADLSQALTAKVEAYQQEAEAAGEGEYIAKCIGTTPKPEKCEKPALWLGAPPSGCKDVQEPKVQRVFNYVSAFACGSRFFQKVFPESEDEIVIKAYELALNEWIKSRLGSKLCCDKLREDSKRTDQPCYGVWDVDCDGVRDEDDVTANGMPDINIFSTAEGAQIDPFPPGLNPDDTEFLPPQDKCECKWELLQGTLNCSPGGGQRHYYEARWRCPSTGNERYTRKYAAATAPCTPPKRRG